MGSSLWWRKQLLNFDNNRQYIRDNYNFYARIQHKLSGDDTQSSVKNVFYTLQADYSAYNAKLENPNHGKNYFNYGYVGKFTPSIDDMETECGLDNLKHDMEVDNSEQNSGDQIVDSIVERYLSNY